MERKLYLSSYKSQLNSKVYQAYDQFNQAHSLIPQPETYGAYLVTNYSRPKGLKSYPKPLFASESETMDSRYSKSNMERLNLQKRRQVLGSYKQAQGLTGSKIKPVVLVPRLTRELTTDPSGLGLGPQIGKDRP